MGRLSRGVHFGAARLDRAAGSTGRRSAGRIGWALALLLSALLSAPALPAVAAPAAQVPTTADDAETLLVRFRASRSAAATLRAQGARVRREITGTGFTEVSVDGRPVETVRRALSASPAVADVEPNRIRRTTAVPNDTHYAEWQAPYLTTINLPGAWDTTGGRDDLVMAIVDTGVDLTHPDLAPRLVAGFDVVNNDSVADDDNGHGTMVAGIAGARTNNAAGVAGVTWAGRIMPVKVLDSSGTGTDADVAAGIVWAADHGAKVINLSLGGPGESKTLQAAIDHARARNIVVVAAAGNEASDVPHWPAAATGVVAVGATTISGDLATFSNYGSWVDVVAPGVNVTSTARHGGYAMGSGTSFASPIVAGVAALAWAADPAADAVTIANRLSSTAIDLGLPGVDLTFGSGLVDALATVLLAPALSAPPPPPSPPVAAPAPPVAAPAPPAAPVRSGYWMLGGDGRVFAFGDAAGVGETTAHLGGASAADIEPTPSGAGYWVLDERGGVFGYGDARYLGRVPTGDLAAGERAISLSATPTGNGYWVFTTRGRAVAFGDAGFLGDMRAVPLNGPVIGSVATPNGRGYYMVASDGGIFSFGDARFHGSMGDKKLNAPVRGLVPDPDGTGYWLVASDGGVFAFDAGFRGSMGGKPLNAPITGMVAYGDGYLMVGTDGGIFSFSDKAFVGSLGATPPARPIVSVAVLP